MGVFGYFPTYTLGNLYAAQFFAAANEQIHGLPARIEKGDLATLLGWLRDNIHCHGQLYRAHELAEHVTGKPLTIDAFIQYVRDKFSPIYGL
jgi:carboxypeptidase Taq